MACPIFRCHFCTQDCADQWFCLESGCAARAQQERPLPLQPAAAYRENLADKAVGRLAAKICIELSIFLCTGESPKRHLSFQSLLRSRISLYICGRICGIVDEILGDGIDLHIVGRDLSITA